ncbi:permease [Aliarcobacter butzleri]|uniref:Permease n=1 Tax=Aliarcobacter butzleri L351 TaxID=1447259 RepID=A0A837J5G8_9BACT|nr:permease [Aliarcobacter butzleri]KLE00762.1 permease [Aliarcobacter butzleri L351]KLE11867.1 permease [Aliarcobacter butzleri L350]MDN5047642.1 permease [Aliarcobacter butzleri]MDN5059443.1 permease [Aliarcobacter butzleri]MDN5110259.1 permease [Aliarcobacter butzleri]
MFEWWNNLSAILVFDILGLVKGTKLGDAVHFFIFDTIKIFILLIVIVYLITFLRSYFPLEKIRVYLSGKNKIIGHILASIFGIITPFCSCSAIPLFLGFLQARIPLGVAFSYLVSAPLSDPVVFALLISMFSWKIAVLYVVFGVIISIVVGLIIGAMNMEKEVLIEVKPLDNISYTEDGTLFKHRIKESWDCSVDIFKKIYLYIIIGVGVGAFIHGFIPEDFISKYAGGDVWYAPIVAVIVGIPMYSNELGILPIIEVLTQKGVLIGTALSFMMAIVALSLPEAMILKRVISIKLIGIFFGVVGLAILLTGYTLNYFVG